MRHHHMRCVTAGAAVGATELARAADADVLLAAQAGGALAATDPRKRRITRADLDVLHIGADGDDFAFDLMAQRVRQLHIRHRQLVAAAQIEIAVMDMDVRMADAGIVDLEENLGACRGRCRRLQFLKRLAEFRDHLTEHERLPWVLSDLLSVLHGDLPLSTQTIPRHGPLLWAMTFYCLDAR